MSQGEKIRALRISKGLTQQQLADKTNINVRTIQRIESGEVAARLHSLHTIAEVLGCDPATFYSDIKEAPMRQETVPENKGLLVWLHLGGLLFLPSLMIWLFEKDRVRGIKEQGIDVINFQLSMLVILIPLLAFAPLAILLALFTTAVVLLNTVKVIFGKPYHYPASISFLKHGKSYRLFSME
ncbi:helix-turn-helix domain-containing protein [Dyadobacter psychrotolerans]|uniref:Helix-turn-helix domain-containing protein n=1 Tax=Dyadobacter psychrotolerans TaxID=2541721 RepID=A0A4R5DJ01_9BACT|nr:helix-turn-helix domain-containing protein [Dyadobacter psychrotolerans]TDE10503.1 helix-turn-helix domain-containing protein [Dyadobacter psychrotolerans]